MKLSILTLAALLALACAVEPDQTIKKADKDFLEKQAKVLSLYVGLGTDLETKHHHEHKDFPYNDPKYYKNPKVLEGFMESYERGLLDRHGVFTMYCHKNRHDTFHIFDIMYFAKDFDTLFDIASWARHELNPLQFFYTFTMAVLHREDTRGFYLPPIYEVFPHYFLQSFYFNEAASHHTFSDDDEVIHNFNHTSWEYSWHKEITGGIYPNGPKWNGDDYQSKMSYFREDSGWANSFGYWNMRFAPWLSTQKYPDIHFSHRGEYLYYHYKWLLDRYTLERAYHKLPAITTFELDKPMPGYNSHLEDYMGRAFLVRSEGLVPTESNADAAWECSVTENRIHRTIDVGFYWSPDANTPETILKTSDRKGFDTFSGMIYATRESYNRKYYKALHYQLLDAAKDVVTSPNDRDYTYSVLELPMTQVRDPAFYSVLATIDSWFHAFLDKMPSYTDDELNFPGVSLEKFEVSKLLTYNDRNKFELTNGFSVMPDEDRYKKRSFYNQYQLNHEPFEYEFTVKSDKEQDAMIRVMIGPKRDSDGRLLTLNQKRNAFITLNKYIVKLNAGDNVFKKHSFQPEFYNKYENFHDFYARVNKSIESGESFEYSELNHCGIPYNLQLPRGGRSGIGFTMFVMVTPYFEDKIDKDGYYQCHHNKFMDQFPIRFPFDRPIKFPDHFMHDNMHFHDVKIFHEYFKPKH